ncbi:Glycosyl transferase family 2 [Caprobacter fermentans]|uniref:Glycosyl transferase family 2 n=2 Tax=Caproicibacter fermentans TaxID=2576756 RepID=A0A6N8HVA3_9FIRM|nr:Glycosyl transferase family 2 [Caproicibacter fermentans]
MKARIKKSASDTREIHLSSDGPYHGHPIRLSIGMIVKNEEKTLDRCLSSLKPLMEAVESELIITDTGSTDSTVEIAKKYTDHIIHFEWCDDFSAARNTGLKEARGEWFLFLDGDEWFENTDELIEFFTSGECDKYGSASYIQRNYTDSSGKNYIDFHALRLNRVIENCLFINQVHEAMPRITPTKFFKDYAHHYGYVCYSRRERMKKSQRNIRLLEMELEENPLNLKAYYELSREYFGFYDLDTVEYYCTRGLKIEEEHPDHIWKLSIFQSYVKALYKGKAYQKVLELVEKMVREDPQMEIIWMDYHYYAQNAAFQIRDYERSNSHGLAYLKVYEQYQAGRLDNNMLLFANFDHIKETDKEQVLYLLGVSFLFLHNYKEVEKIIDQLDSLDPAVLGHGLLLISRMCAETEKWEQLASFYQNKRSVEASYKIDIMKEIEAVLPLEEKMRADAAIAFAALPDKDDAYVRMNCLRNEELNGDKDAVECELDWFLRWEGKWSTVYSDVLFFAMQEKMNILKFILKIEVDEFRPIIDNMQKHHNNFPEVIKEYLKSYSFENLKGLYWSICLRENLLMMETKNFAANEDEMKFFIEYARQSAKYVRSIFRSELLSPDRVTILPRAYRFGFYMGQALAAQEKSDSESYLRNLRFALKSYEGMNRPISVLLDYFEQEEKLRREKAEEFNKLAKQVKERIKILISQGKLKEAGQVTAQLAALMPNDPDVVKFRTLTHTEPDMKELAAQLPQ